VEGALEAARDLMTLWNKKKRAQGEFIAAPSETILVTVN
jgi:hypothetical protein